MAATICFYLANEQARCKIVEEAYRLATEDLTMERSLDRIIRLGIEPRLHNLRSNALGPTMQRMRDH